LRFDTLTVPSTELLLRKNASIARYTTFGIGGPADVLAEVYTETALQQVVREAVQSGMRWLLIGGGSNLLVGDTGFRGVVIVNKIEHLRVEGTRIVCGAGADLGEVVEAAREHALSGMEFAIDIPGTVGGAVRGNAGAFGRSVADVLTRIRLLEGVELVDRTPADLGFAYRHSNLKENTHIVVETEFSLKPGDRTEMDRIMGQHAAQRARREEKGLHTAGCFFKNPVLPDGSKIAAGQLLEAAGAKEIKDGRQLHREQERRLRARDPPRRARDEAPGPGSERHHARGRGDGRDGSREEGVGVGRALPGFRFFVYPRK
jgi:UDP-N-acetylmuramate dehydrogenase